MRGLQEREIREVMVVYDGPGEGVFFGCELELGLEGCEAAVGVVEDELGVEFRD